MLLNYKRCIKTRKRCFFLLKSCLKIGVECEKPRRTQRAQREYIKKLYFSAFSASSAVKQTLYFSAFSASSAVKQTLYFSAFSASSAVKQTLYFSALSASSAVKQTLYFSALSASSTVLFISCVPGCSNLFPRPRSCCSACPARRFPFQPHHRVGAIVRDSWGRSVCRCR